MSKDNYSLCLPGFQRCKRCKTVFPHTLEYFSTNKSKLRNVCRQCTNKAQNKLRKRPGIAEKTNAKRREQLKDPIKGKETRRKDRERRAANPEKYRDYDRNRRAEGEPREEHRRKQRDYYWNNHEKILANPRKHAIHESKRRAKIRGLPYEWTNAHWIACLEYWNNKCCVCGRMASDTHFLAQEHWIAVKDNRPDNPGTVPWNMLPMCHSYRGRGASPGCNNSKWVHDPITWIKSKYPPDEANEILKRITDYFEWMKSRE